MSLLSLSIALSFPKFSLVPLLFFSSLSLASLVTGSVCICVELKSEN